MPSIVAKKRQKDTSTNGNGQERVDEEEMTPKQERQAEIVAEIAAETDKPDTFVPRKRRRLSGEPTTYDDSDEEDDIGLLVKPAAIKVALQKTSFAALGIKPWLVHALSQMAILRPTGIQARCIPELLAGRDCIGGSRTGSGKTLAFAAPIIQQWARDPVGIFALILTPTRELALQIFEQFKAIASSQQLRPILVTGGADMRAQALELSKRPHVVVATPGRLADHIHTSGEDTVCGLRRVKFVVLDEADRLLEAGPGSMLPDVEECMGALPPPARRQTCLFTATLTPEVRALKDMDSQRAQPVAVCEVDLDALAVPATLRQWYIKVPMQHREAFLHVLLQTPANADKSVIVFCNRTATAALLEHLLRLLGHRVTALHSGLPQKERSANLAKFRAGMRVARILVATDVAARGLDIAAVGLVVNFNVPRDPDDYIHRVGRTARAGRAGDAVTLVSVDDVDRLLAIESRVGGGPMAEFAEAGVSVEGRVVREALKPVGEKRREALLQIEQGRDFKGQKKAQPAR